MIRVLRLMEYTFESLDQAQKHLGQCFVQNDGTPKEIGHRTGGTMTIRSTIIVTPFSVALDDFPE